jgi:cell division protein FtsX
VAAVIWHALAEGWLLLRQRGVVSLILSLALAVPVCLAGVTWSMMGWLQPVVGLADQANVVAVLLHPHMDEDQRTGWLQGQRDANPGWEVNEVPPEELAARLTHWFPYLKDLLDEDGVVMLPPLVEISTSDPESVSVLTRSPAVIAVGPRVPVRRILGAAAGGLALVLGGASVVLLLSAALLAAVWVHLELYRHADEITVMRLGGATEAALQGPFLVATAAPGLVAAVLAILGTLTVTDWLSRLTGALALPPVTVSPLILAAQAAVGILLPLAAATITLARHAVVELES